RMHVQAAMVNEIRRLFAKTGETQATSDLIILTLHIQSPCREASFWQAMCDIRMGALDSALTNLQVARTGQCGGITLDTGFAEAGEPGAPPAPPSSFLDP